MKQYFFKAILVLFVIINGCANIVPPSGGDKDITPPQILSQYPDNQSIKFNSNKIKIEFDEYIQVNQSTGSIIISPPLENDPIIATKGKTLEIIFKEELQANTTYTINFGESIKDWNEGNVLRDYVYLFSTGKYLDSVTLQGKVIDAYNKKPIDKTTVILYKENTDSILTKAKPYYFVNTNSSGQFNFTHLKEGTYQIAALKDENLNYIFDQNSEQVAFLNQTIELSSTHQLTEPLILFKEEESLKTEINLASKNHLQITSNQKIETIFFDADIFNEKDIAYINENNDTLDYWFISQEEKAIIYTQINNQKIDTTTKSLKSQKETTFNIKAKKDEWTIEENYIIKSSSPIETIDPSKIILKDTAENILPVELNINANKNELLIRANWEKDVNYILNVEKGALINFLGTENKNRELSFTSQEKAIPANLILYFPEEYHSKNLIIELLSPEEKLIEEVYYTHEKVMSFSSLPPQSYILRIYEDSNQNGKWTTGDFHVKQQPEKTLFFKSIELKANWDKEIELEF